MDSFSGLPAHAVFPKTFELLGLIDLKHTEAVCCDFRLGVKEVMHQKKVMAYFSLPKSKELSYRWVIPRCTGIQMLQLGTAPWMTDEKLRIIAKAAPPLAHLGLQDCGKITDLGVEEVVKAVARTLEVLNLVGTRSTTYASAISAHRIAAAAPRTAGIQPLCVMRLPAFLVGHFETPRGEVHTYWPDGSFDFGRDQDSVGWIVELNPCSHHTALRGLMQFIDDEVPWPTNCDDAAAQTAEILAKNRTGMLVRTARDDGTYVMVQSVIGPSPPVVYTAAMNTKAASVRAGAMIEYCDPEAGPVIVSRMRHQFLKQGTVAPPREILSRLADFVDRHPLVLRVPHQEQP